MNECKDPLCICNFSVTRTVMDLDRRSVASNLAYYAKFAAGTCFGAMIKLYETAQYITKKVKLLDF